MSLREKILTDIKQALKAGDKKKTEVLRFLNAQIIDKEIEQGKKELKDEDITKLINNQLKKLEEALEFAKKGERQDLVEKNQAEIAVLKTYLPAQISNEALEKEIDQIIKDNPNAPHPGALIGMAVKKLAGKADNKKISELVLKKVKK